MGQEEAAQNNASIISKRKALIPFS